MISYRCSTTYPVRTGEVQFGTLPDDEIRQMSTVQVKDTTIYYRGLPNPYGINDHRMGTVDRRLLCGTCCRDVKECQGHTGHIELAFPMYHIGFFDTCLKALRCICYGCSHILLSKEEISALRITEEGKARFQIIYNMVKARKKCCHCGMSQPSYVRLTHSIRTDWLPEADWESVEEKEYCSLPFTQRDALSILTHIPDDHKKVLGFNEFCNPKDMLMCTVLVPPPVARPAIMASEGSRSRGQDDLTHKLQDINKRSIDLQNAYPQGETWREVVITPELLEKIQRLQFEVFTYMNNNIRGQKQSTQRSGAPTKSITDRLKGKDGRIRGNLMGKRVDFSARSVITPDATMDIDEVGIPLKVAMTMTVPVRVTSYNIEELTRRVANGMTDIHGAETVITCSGVMINLAHCENRCKIRLQFGWVVERFLTDGDIVIFNRQPSLHKVGMMGHRVKLMSGDTFRLNLCCANPYNADFDGDEMNLHVPQSPSAIADVATIMMVPRQIISPQANRPVMGIVQDSLLGAYLFSRNDVLLTRLQACHLVAHLRYQSSRLLPPPCVLLPEELWSGKQLVSLLFPPDFCYGTVARSADLSLHSEVVVRGGELLTGELRKAAMGTSSGGFVDVLFRQYGCVLTARWMSEVQRLVNAWLCTRGFSVGVQDCVLGVSGEERVRERIETTLAIAQELIDEGVATETEEARVLEGTVVRILNKCLMQTGGIVDEELGDANAVRMMVQAGSKGNPINLSQICGCVGQQSVEGRRVFAEKGGRTLSCFSKYGNSLESQGFVQNSYALGLQPHEYFFHAMGGREGLVDTSVKTATTGYIQRRQVKAMEDHKVCYDGTVRNAEECIVDFSYGGDSMDPTRVERVVLPMLREPEEALHARLEPWEAEKAVFCRGQLLKCKSLPIDPRVLLPFAPLRLYQETRLSSESSVDVVALREVVREAVLQAPSLLLRATILDFFNARALQRRSFTKEHAIAIFALINDLMDSALVNCGEMVGSIAAQSIGEPCAHAPPTPFFPLPLLLRPPQTRPLATNVGCPCHASCERCTFRLRSV
jgi:DNA-directed RNA polymerase II subunit RPB1